MKEFLYFDDPYYVYELNVRDMSNKEIVELMKKMGCKNGEEVGTYNYKDICIIGLYDVDDDGQIELALDGIIESYDDEYKLEVLSEEIRIKARKLEEEVRKTFIAKFEKDFIAYSKKNKLDASITVKNVSIIVDVYKEINPKIEAEIQKYATKYGLEVDIRVLQYSASALVIKLNDYLAESYKRVSGGMIETKRGAFIVPSVSGDGKRVIISLSKSDRINPKGAMPLRDSKEYKELLSQYRNEFINDYRKLNIYIPKDCLNKSVNDGWFVKSGKQYYTCKVDVEFMETAELSTILNTIEYVATNL